MTQLSKSEAPHTFRPLIKQALSGAINEQVKGVLKSPLVRDSIISALGFFLLFQPF